MIRTSKKKVILHIFAIVAFIITFYLVEFSSSSSRALETYNQGYGTFDMKLYNENMVTEVLETMQPEGFDLYRQYLIWDYLFLLAFGALQILIVKDIFGLWKKEEEKNAGFHQIMKAMGLVTIAITVARGIFDLVENRLLFAILHDYPQLNSFSIHVSAIATKLKLLCIGIWLIMIVIGMVLRRIGRSRG